MIKKEQCKGINAMRDGDKQYTIHCDKLIGNNILLGIWWEVEIMRQRNKRNR